MNIQYPSDDTSKNTEYDKNYIEWQKAFVNGSQLTEPCIVDGAITPLYKQFYWQSDKVFNLIGERVKLWMSKYDELSLYGKGKVIDQIIPYQQEYNILMNRITEISNMIALPIMMVEDGSVDTDELSEDGLAPGKIILYRQGAKAPQTMNIDSQVIANLYSVAQGVKQELLQLMVDIECNLEISKNDEHISSLDSSIK